MKQTSKIPQAIIKDKKLLSGILNKYKNLNTIPDPDDVRKIKVLDVDINGTLETNYVKNEIHNIDVPNYSQIIQPDAGSFYLPDLELTVVASGQKLVEGIDYELVGMNYGKTKITKSTSALWDFIFILSPIVGDVSINYRAFGGQVTRLNIDTLKALLIQIISALSNGEFLKCEDLPGCQTIIDIENEIHTISGLMPDIEVVTEDMVIPDKFLKGRTYLSNRGATMEITCLLPKGTKGDKLNVIIEANQYLRIQTQNLEKFSFQNEFGEPDGFIRSNLISNNWAIIFTGVDWLILNAEGPILCDM